MGRTRRRNSSAPLMDLSEHIMVEILLRLPIKGIVMCECACKPWRLLISSSHFAELHFACSKACILVGDKNCKYVSRMIYLIEPCEINNSCCSNTIETSLPVNLKLDTKLKLPLFNYEVGDAEASDLCKGIMKRKPTIKLNPMLLQIVYVVNSCKGFLCMESNERLSICNPVTKEYINIPANTISSKYQHTRFGFCGVTKQYKVLKVLAKRYYHPIAAEIYNLGINSWKSIGPPPRFYQPIDSPMCVNGSIYGIKQDGSGIPCILSFEFSGECFKLLPRPPIDKTTDTSVGTIADCLCLCAEFMESTDFWALKNCGGQEFWLKLIRASNQGLRIRDFSTSLVTSCTKCESFLLFGCDDHVVAFYDCKREEWKKFRIHPKRFQAEAIVHTPSFSRLKDVAPGADVISISTGFKLPGETRSPYLTEEA